MKIMYIQPSVQVTEMQMVQTLCASGSSTPDPGVSFSPVNPNATTNTQL
ncbi:MAG: hypothetical protein IJS00_07540 [Paludibacteraceae bacterium]|nr:hypothetical protein [Paludibacteraceae bacterium]